MGTAEMIAASSLVVVLLLAIKVISMQRQLHILQNQLQTLLSRESSMTSSTRDEHRNNKYSHASPNRGSFSLNMQLQAELTSLLQNGQSIRAIKKLREATGLSLIEAKQMVDQLEGQIKP
ncbi:hypothetical protein D3C77_565230 [compost metagenome]